MPEAPCAVGSQGASATFGLGGTPGPPGATGAAQPLTFSNVGNAGVAKTIPAATTDQLVTYTLNSPTCAFTAPAPAQGCRIVVHLTQDGTGGRLATWVGVGWGNAGTPVLSTSAGKRDTIILFCADGAHWDGAVAGLGY